ncbi:MAG: PilZ domain-containing protein [Methylococcaceae bacterium]|nr:PilZ domain-containing protein [Methylococcaceae bacterium]
MTELNPNTENRAYRKSLAGTGLIYLGFVEYEVRVLNLSVSGFLAELKLDVDLKDVFEALQVSPVIDIYLPEMRLAGEAEVVRVDSIENGFHIGIEFRNVSYDVDNLLYNRRAYRKNMTASGHMVINGLGHAFSTANVSVDGLMIRILGHVDVEEGAVTHFDFKHLELQGDARVVWVDTDDNSTLMGLQYIRLERDEIKGVPQFVRPL